MDDQEHWEVVAVVTAVAPEVATAALEAPGGASFAVNRRTVGVDVLQLHEGQRLTLRLQGHGVPRVLSATILEAA